MGSRQGRFGFGVGDRNGIRSSIWTVVAGDAEAYVLYEQFGHEGKISLHASGAGHWRGGRRVGSSNPDKPVAARFITRWAAPLPSSTTAARVFRVMIPVSQLRPLGPPHSRKKALWLSNAPTGTTAVFDLYRTPPMGDPASHTGLPWQHLHSLPLGGGCWITTLVHLEVFDETFMDDLRQQLRGHLEQVGRVPDQATRGAGFFEGQDGLRGMVEVAML